MNFGEGVFRSSTCLEVGILYHFVLISFFGVISNNFENIIIMCDIK